MVEDFLWGVYLYIYKRSLVICTFLSSHMLRKYSQKERESLMVTKIAIALFMKDIYINKIHSASLSLAFNIYISEFAFENTFAWIMHAVAVYIYSLCTARLSPNFMIDEFCFRFNERVYKYIYIHAGMSARGRHQPQHIRSLAFLCRICCCNKFCGIILWEFVLALFNGYWSRIIIRRTIAMIEKWLNNPLHGKLFLPCMKMEVFQAHNIDVFFHIQFIIIHPNNRFKFDIGEIVWTCYTKNYKHMKRKSCNLFECSSAKNYKLSRTKYNN